MPTRPRRVVGLGLCVIDHLYVVEDTAESEVRTRYRERLVAPGGMVGTAVAQAAALGCDAHLLSVVGDDADGRALRRSMRGFGVVTRGLRLSPEVATTVAVVLVARRGGERRFVVPDRRAIERGAPALDLERIRPDSLLLVDGHFPEQALRAVKRARRLGATVIGDFSRPSPAARRLLPWVDHAIVPEEFARAYGGGDPRRTLRRLRDEYGGTPVVTLGARGLLYLDDGRIRRVPARRTRVRDTTGAGDVFHGAFAAGLARGQDLRGALDLATRAAAACCTRLGATTALYRDGRGRRRRQ